MKASIKKPNLYPTETIEIGDEKIVLSGYKPFDRPLEIQIRHLRLKAIELQIKINKIVRDEDNNTKPDKDLTEEEAKSLIEVYNELDELGDDMDDACMLLAQRGLKRFYYPDKTSSELDEIDDIKIPMGYASMIADKMIKLSNPPSEVEKSLEFLKKQEKADDKGKLEDSNENQTSQ